MTGASTCRLRLVSREPEGRTFGSIDAIIESTRFIPPQPLTDGFAVVRAHATSGCGGAGESPVTSAAEHRLPIDARSACGVGNLTLEWMRGSLRWDAMPGADLERGPEDGHGSVPRH